MTLGKSFYYALTVLFANMTAQYCIFILLTSVKGNAMGFHLLSYFGFAVLALTINCLLSRKERSVLQIVILNAFIAVLGAIVLFVLPHEISGFWGYLCAGLIFLYPAPRGVFLLRNPFSIGKMLSWCEMSALGTSVFFIAQLGYFSPGAVPNILCVVALIGNLAALSSMRMQNIRQTGERGGTGPKRWLLLAALGAIILFFAGLLALLLPLGRGAILAAIETVKNLLLAILHLILRFLLFLFSLLPVPEFSQGYIPAPDPVAIPDGAVEGYLEFPLIVTIVIVSLIAALAIALFVFIVYRMRRVRLGALGSANSLLKVKSTAPSLLSLLRAMLRRLRERLSLRLLLLTRFNSCAGVLARLEYRGKRCGVPRGKGQTTREYLMTLLSRSPQADPTAREAFLLLADRIDELCFSTKRQNGRMDRMHIKAILKSVKPHRRIRKLRY